MVSRLSLHQDRLLPIEAGLRGIAQDLLATIEDMPIVSPHGHVPVAWFDPQFHFRDATDLLIRPDHYVLRMFASQGYRYEDLGVAGKDSVEIADSRTAFRTFAANYDLFLGTPTRSWLDHALYEVLQVSEPLTGRTADAVLRKSMRLWRAWNLHRGPFANNLASRCWRQPIQQRMIWPDIWPCGTIHPGAGVSYQPFVRTRLPIPSIAIFFRTLRD